MEKLKGFAKYLRLTDENGQLSITNVMMFVVVAKLAMAPQAGLAEVSSLVLALLAYNGKRYLAHTATAKEKARQVSDAARLDKLEAEQRQLVQTVNLKNLGR